MEDLAGVLRTVPFTLLSVAIDKAQLKERYACSVNPYDLALAKCVQRVFAFLRNCDQAGRHTSILIEKRGKSEDRQLQAVFSRICEGENLRGASAELSVEMIDKKANLAGLQIADLVGTPVGRHLLRPDDQNRAFDAIRHKLHTLITLP